MTELNVKNLRPKKPYGKTLKNCTAKFRADMLHRRDSGQSYQTIANAYGISYYAVYHFFNAKK